MLNYKLTSQQSMITKSALPIKNKMRILNIFHKLDEVEHSPIQLHP